jgi:hypothetical protein
MNELECRMLEAGSFVIDGWTSPRGHAAAAKLKNKGLVVSRQIGSNEAQYTGIQFTVTAKGRAALNQKGNKGDEIG